jgi:serine/threonine protein phosphatase PrpC
MNCPACGAENREGAHFCRRCGSEMTLSGPDRALSAVEAQAPSEQATEPEGLAAEPEESAGAIPSATEEAQALSEGQRSEGETGDEMRADQSTPGAETLDAEPESTLAETGAPPEQIAEATAPLNDAGEPAEPEAELLAFWRDEGEPLVAASPGTVLADRYLVIEVLDVQEDTILYQAQDLGLCWHCGFEGDLRQDAFCPQCGASLDRKPDLRLVQVRDAGAEPPAGEKVAARLSDEELNLLILSGPEPEGAEVPGSGGIRLLIGQRSDPGIVRELNEDSLLALTMAPTCQSRTGPVLGLFAVADGMGGHEGGEIASKMALQILADRVIRDIVLPEIAGQLALEEDILAQLRQATMATNDAVYLARQKRSNDMGTTLTTAVIRDDRLFLAHVGDCRAYRWNDQGLEQLTTDHSVVASMVSKGEAAPDEVYTHPHRSVIYRCIGDRPTVEVDGDVLPLCPGDRIILCSDGLWEMVRDEGIEDVMLQEPNPQAACDLLVKHANLAGGEDNISLIIVHVEAH